MFRYIIITVNDRKNIPDLVRKLAKHTQCAQVYPIEELPNVLRVDIIEGVLLYDAEIFRNTIKKKYHKYIHEISPVIPDGKLVTKREKEQRKKKRRKSKELDRLFDRKIVTWTFILGIIMICSGIIMMIVGITMMDNQPSFSNQTFKFWFVEIPAGGQSFAVFFAGMAVMAGGIYIITNAVIRRA